MRNHRLESDHFEAAARRAGVYPPEFTEEASRRLAKGGREYGDDSWQGKDLLEFARELKEEGLDLAAWSALCIQRYPENRAVLEICHEIATIGAAGFLAALRLETLDIAENGGKRLTAAHIDYERRLRLAELQE